MNESYRMKRTEAIGFLRYNFVQSVVIFPDDRFFSENLPVVEF